MILSFGLLKYVWNRSNSLDTTDAMTPESLFDLSLWGSGRRLEGYLLSCGSDRDAVRRGESSGLDAPKRNLERSVRTKSTFGDGLNSRSERREKGH